jgi:hypothetical protein
VAISLVVSDNVIEAVPASLVPEGEPEERTGAVVSAGGLEVDIYS